MSAWRGTAWVKPAGILTVTSLWMVALILIGVACRWPSLGSPDFDVDEVLHAYAAEALIDGQEPTLPDGQPYKRALLFTRLVASIGELLGFDERTARIPSLLFGVVMPLALFLVGRSWFSPRVGLVAGALAAIVPTQIVFSRLVRMYTLFQLLFLILIFLLFYLFEPGARLSSDSTRQAATLTWRGLVARKKLKPALLVVVLMPLAYHVHPLLVAGLAGPLVFFAARTLFILFFGEAPAVDRSYRLLLLGAIGVVGSLVVRSKLAFFVSSTQYAPAWAESTSEDTLFYLRALWERFPAILFIVGALGMAWGHKDRLTRGYLVCCLAVPLLLQSLVLPWKTYRYIFYLLPVVFLLFADGLDICARRLVSLLGKKLKTAVRMARSWETVLVVAGLLAVVIGAGWVGEVIHYVGSDVTAKDGVWHNNWRGAVSVATSNSESRATLLTTKPLLAAYYGDGEELFMLNKRVDLQDKPHFGAGGGRVQTVGDISRLVSETGVVWFVGERWLFYDPGTVPRTVRGYLETAGERFFREEAADMVIIRLQAQGEEELIGVSNGGETQ